MVVYDLFLEGFKWIFKLWSKIDCSESSFPKNEFGDDDPSFQMEFVEKSDPDLILVVVDNGISTGMVSIDGNPNESYVDTSGDLIESLDGNVPDLDRFGLEADESEVNGGLGLVKLFMETQQQHRSTMWTTQHNNDYDDSAKELKGNSWQKTGKN